MESKKPDFKKAYVRANDILAASGTLVTFPVNTKKIVQEWSDIKVLSFEYAISRGIDIEAFGSEAAVIQCKGGRYIIFYNQDDYTPRVKFSILHEFGHYYLDHKFKKYENDEEYGRIEVEANCFAAQVLMPEQVLNELKKRGAVITIDFLRVKFGVSEEAAKKRIETMGKLNYSWRSEEEKLMDEVILFKYKDFMDSILPERNKKNMLDDYFEKQLERDNWDFDTRTRYRY